MKKNFKKFFALSFVMVLLSACAATEDTISEQPVEQLYMQGYNYFKEKEYEQSARYFDEIDRQYPYSVWAPRAQIMAAYAYYSANQYDDAVLTLDRFIQLHPGNKNIVYAYYLKGLCYYEQMSDVSREQKMTEDALTTFQEILSRYPNSIYTADINVKLQEIEAHLAGKEMTVGRYYLKRHEYIPAMNRFQNVLLEHPKTNQTPEALYRLVVCYLSLGMNHQAEQLGVVLEQYYTDTSWTQKALKLIKKQQEKTLKEEKGK